MLRTCKMFQPSKFTGTVSKLFSLLRLGTTTLHTWCRTIYRSGRITALLVFTTKSIKSSQTLQGSPTRLERLLKNGECESTRQNVLASHLHCPPITVNNWTSREYLILGYVSDYRPHAYIFTVSVSNTEIHCRYSTRYHKYVHPPRFWRKKGGEQEIVRISKQYQERASKLSSSEYFIGLLDTGFITTDRKARMCLI